MIGQIFQLHIILGIVARQCHLAGDRVIFALHWNNEFRSHIHKYIANLVLVEDRDFYKVDGLHLLDITGMGLIAQVVTFIIYSVTLVEKLFRFQGAFLLSIVNA